MVEQFGTSERSISLCMVILSGVQAKDILEITELFYLKIILKLTKRQAQLSATLIVDALAMGYRISETLQALLNVQELIKPTNV